MSADEHHPNIATPEALQAAARLIDDSFDTLSEELAQQGLASCDAIERQGISDEVAVVLDYYRANAWAALAAIRRQQIDTIWSWDQPELEQQVLLLRRSRTRRTFDAADVTIRCSVCTNLANLLDSLGRCVESRALWTEALKIEPHFWMARANRGRGLMFYANALYDPGHQSLFAWHADRDLRGALASMTTHPEFGDVRIRPFFEESAATIRDHFDLDGFAETYRPDDFSLGETKQEIRFRNWCRHRTLFLNPLNDATDAAIGARDVMMLPTFTTNWDEPPVVLGFFNQIKKEFATARWLLYAGTQLSPNHISDIGVDLYDSEEAHVTGHRIEQIKLSYRVSYSLFDKMAYFLNRYFDLKIPEKRVSFRGIWDSKHGARARIESTRNNALRALYWLSRDLFEAGFQETSDPDARELDDLRNHLEHKHVVVCRSDVTADLARFGRHIGLQDLERKAFRLLRLARAALVYMLLGMHHEESRRAAESPGRRSVSIQVPVRDVQGQRRDPRKRSVW